MVYFVLIALGLGLFAVFAGRSLRHRTHAVSGHRPSRHESSTGDAPAIWMSVGSTSNDATQDPSVGHDHGSREFSGFAGGESGGGGASADFGGSDGGGGGDSGGGGGGDGGGGGGGGGD